MARKPVIPGDTRATARSAVVHGGAIVDGTKAALPGATITVQNVGTGDLRTTVAGDTGESA